MFADVFIRYFGMIVVVFMLTALYGRATPFHTLASALLQAVAVSYLAVYCGGAIWSNIMASFAGQPLSIIGVIIGAMLFFRFSSRYSVLARIPIAFTTGTMLGLAFRTVVFTEIIGFAKTAVVPLFTPTNMYQTFVNISIAVFTATVLFFFTYTFPRLSKEPIGRIGKFGEIVLYGALGGVSANAFLSYAVGATGSITNYLKPTSDAALFFIIGIIAIVVIIALDKRKILDKYS